MRILVTVAPCMYREVLALAIHQRRPDIEILIAPLATLNGHAESFGPHLLVRNDTDGADMDRLMGALCWVEILYSDGMDARVSLDGEVWEIENISTEDLLEIVDRTEELMLEGTPFG